MPWCHQFSHFTVTQLNHSISDHCLIMVNTGEEFNLKGMDGRRLFMFNANWCLEESCENMI